MKQVIRFVDILTDLYEDSRRVILAKATIKVNSRSVPTITILLLLRIDEGKEVVKRNEFDWSSEVIDEPYLRRNKEYLCLSSRRRDFADPTARLELLSSQSHRKSFDSVNIHYISCLRYNECFVTDFIRCEDTISTWWFREFLALIWFLFGEKK